MPSLTMSIPHRLTRAEAKRRVQEHVAQLRQQAGSVLGNFQDRWDGDTMEFTLAVSGVSLTGHVYVEDEAVRLDIPLPWPLSMLADQLKPMIEQRGRKLLTSG
jgi:hypothetical protein